MIKKNPHGGDIYTNKVDYDFSANINPLGTPDSVKKAIIESADTAAFYPDPFCTELRAALSEHHKRNADHIICGNGAADLIYTFANAYKPESALIFSPAFCEYENSLNCDIFYEFDSCKFYDVIYLCNPNNPTGSAVKKSDVLKLTANCNILFVDECFMDLADFPDLYSVTDVVSDKIFILRAFTKSYGMAGLRLGYGITSNTDLISEMYNATQTWNVSSVAQKAGTAALKCGDFIEKTREIISTEREYLTCELRSLGFEVYDSAVNFILFKSCGNLYDNLLKRRILIRNCGNFRGLDDTFYRCAVRSREENTVLINTIKEIIYGKS